MYFLIISGLLATLRKKIGIYLLCALAVVFAIQNRAILLRNPAAPSENRAVIDTAWRFALRHPGEVYFPMMPLASVMAEKKAYHYPIGVWERETAGIPVTPPHLRAGLPDKMKWIVLGPSRWWRKPVSLRFSDRPHLDNFSITEMPDLPGWIVYAKDY